MTRGSEILSKVRAESLAGGTVLFSLFSDGFLQYSIHFVTSDKTEPSAQQRGYFSGHLPGTFLDHGTLYFFKEVIL